MSILLNISSIPASNELLILFRTDLSVYKVPYVSLGMLSPNFSFTFDMKMSNSGKVFSDCFFSNSAKYKNALVDVCKKKSFPSFTYIPVLICFSPFTWQITKHSEFSSSMEYSKVYKSAWHSEAEWYIRIAETSVIASVEGNDISNVSIPNFVDELHVISTLSEIFSVINGY